MVLRLNACARALAILLAAAAAPRSAAACPGEGACQVDGGSYILDLPQSAATGGETGQGVPALMYLHGWGASAAGVMTGRAAMREILQSRGYALIAPQGMPRAGRTQNDWSVEDRIEHPRDDLAFFDAVLEDAARRGVDRDRVLLAGFSRGGSMVWDVACKAPGLVRGYAPIAGAFWEPLPREGCAGPVVLFHTHGWADTVVPLEGRPIGKVMMQGDVFAALKIMRETLGCAGRQPDQRESAADTQRWTRSWQRCAAGRIDLMLHPGSHVVPGDWTELALDWFEDRLAEGS
ncbi:MAG: polyhydroxybutyrate depolymerase [Pseudomonadota bacterium]